MKHVIHTSCRHPLIHDISQCRNPHIQNILKKCADHTECQEKHKSHNSDKARNRCIFSGKDLIDFHAPEMFFTLFWLHDRLIADFFDKIKAHMSNGCCSVQSTFLFHLFNDVLKCLLLVLIQFQTLHDQGITFCKLRCCKPYRYTGRFCMILDQMHDGMKASVDCAAVFIYITKINRAWRFLVLCHMYRMMYQFINSLIFRC